MVELNPDANLEELAQAIAQLPDGADFSQGPTGKLFDALVLGKSHERDPARYAIIFQLTSEQPAATPWMQFACGIQVINGRRRVTGADLPGLVDELNELVSRASEQLPNNLLKFQLLGEASYNLGIMQRGLQQYEQAAKSQSASAAWYGLAGLKDKMLVGLYVGQVEKLTAAFVRGEGGRIVTEFRALGSCRDFIRWSFTDEYPIWMQRNAALHFCFGLMMGFLIHVFGKEELQAHQADFAEGERSPFVHWTKVFQAWRLYREGKFLELSQVKVVDLHSSSRDNTALTIDILVALAQKKLGEAEGFVQTISRVANYSGPDGGIPVAVAKQLLL